MAGFSRIYCIGGEGGFQGADGINPMALQIWVGDADRQWLEAHAFDPGISSLGQVRAVIPAAPDDPDMLLDALIMFYPQHFQGCPSLPSVREQLKGKTRVDFNLGENVPAEWEKLREEARPLMADMAIFEAQLVRIET